jgi:hypothetical protein
LPLASDAHTMQRHPTPTAMLPRLRPTAFVLLIGSFSVLQAASAQDGAEACEEAVIRTVQQLRGAQAQVVELSGAGRAATRKSDREITLRGEGRYHAGSAARSFRYSCAYDTDTGIASGVVLKEAGSPAPRPRERAWDPDLSRLSPEACETAAAASLKRRYPSVGSISFATDTRQLRPAANAGTRLEGQGRMARAPGLNPVRFTYRCELEARSGKLVSVETGD